MQQQITEDSACPSAEQMMRIPWPAGPPWLGDVLCVVRALDDVNLKAQPLPHELVVSRAGENNRSAHMSCYMELHTSLSDTSVCKSALHVSLQLSSAHTVACPMANASKAPLAKPDAHPTPTTRPDLSAVIFHTQGQFDAWGGYHAEQRWRSPGSVIG